LLADYTHTTPTTTECGLDDDWEAIFIREGLDIFELLDWAGSTWDDRDITLDSKFPCGDLVAERVDGVGRGSNELIQTCKLYFNKLHFARKSMSTIDKALRSAEIK